MWSAQRTAPFLPYMFFSFMTPKASATFLSASASKVKGKSYFFLKFLLCFRGIGGDAERHRARLLHLFVCVAEPASLNGSAWGIGARVEIEHNGLATQILERELFFVLILSK